MYKAGIVALLGAPNVGKSSLINAILQEKVAAVSSKPQMTRNAVRCICSFPTAQIVFVDTPGAHEPKHLLGDFMIREISEALQEIDAICYVVEAGRSQPNLQEEELMKLIIAKDIPVILVVNKIDALKHKEQIWKTIELYQNTLNLIAVVPLSARERINLDVLLEELIRVIPESPPIYPEDMIMDSTERFLASEIIREKVYSMTEREVPYSVAVLIEEFKTPEEYPELKTARIRATLIVERQGQKAILIGTGGVRLKEIGREARLEMEERFGYPVFLELWVKVKPNWRKSQDELRRMGYVF